MAPLSFDPRLARKVKVDTLEPAQQPTPRGLRIATNFFQQRLLKFPALGEFHSRAEYLHAGLLEGDPSVRSYVPQPFRLRIGKRRYTPDCFVVSEGAPRRVVELKPGGEFADALQVPVTQFFAQHGLRFEVISNESVLAREIEAENWLEIVRRLYQARDVDATEAEYRVFDRLLQGPAALGDLIDPGDRDRTYPEEVALLRLLHRGHIAADLTRAPLDFDTELARCT